MASRKSLRKQERKSKYQEELKRRLKKKWGNTNDYKKDGRLQAGTPKERPLAGLAATEERLARTTQQSIAQTAAINREARSNNRKEPQQNVSNFQPERRQNRVWGFLRRGVLGATKLGADDMGTAFIALAILQYVIVDYFGVFANSKALVSLIMFFLAITLVLGGEGFFVLIIAFLQLSQFQLDFNIAIVYLAIIIGLIYAFVRGFDEFLDELRNPFVYIALALFAIDFGLFSLLVDHYGLAINDTFASVVLFTPWWVLFAVIKTNPNLMDQGFAKKFVKTLRVLAMAYIVIILLVATYPEGGFSYESGIDVTDSTAARQEQINLLKERGISPFKSLQLYLSCIVSDAANSQKCIDQKKQELQEDLLCNDVLKQGERDGLSKEENVAYQDCISQVRGVDSLKISSAIDKNRRELTTITIEEGTFFNEETSPTDEHSVVLNVKMPREERTRVSVSCRYVVSNKEIDGIVTSADSQGNNIEITKDEESKNVRCRPSEPLPQGNVKLFVSATAHQLHSSTILHRYFVGNDESNDDIIKQSTSADLLKPNDPAYIKFAIGQPADELIIRTSNPEFGAEIRNEGKGELVRVHLAEIRHAQGLRFGNDCSLSLFGGIITNPQLSINGKEKQPQIPFGLCDMVMDTALSNPVRAHHAIYIAELVYDYKFREKEFRLKVKDTGGVSA